MRAIRPFDDLMISTQTASQGNTMAYEFHCRQVQGYAQWTEQSS